MSIKSFLLTLGVFCGGYVSNTLLDNVVEAAEKYFHVPTSTYKLMPMATSFEALRSQNNQ
jgi:hypothetical protein